jgi:hypothetical protein
MALTEAVRHLEKGLVLLAELPPSAERNGIELDLRTALGVAWRGLKGWQAHEVWESLHPALGLANSLHRHDALVAILWGLRVAVLARGRAAEVVSWDKQIQEAANESGNPALPLLGYLAAESSHFCLGDLIECRKCADALLSLYDERRHGRLIDIIGIQDAKSLALTYAASATWILGYPDQAIKISNMRDAHARRCENPFDLGWALTMGSDLIDHLREPEEALKRAREGERLGRENSLPVLWRIFAPMSSGAALIRQGRATEGLVVLKAGLEAWEIGGGKWNRPYFLSILAEGTVQIGDLDGALALIDQAIEQVQRPGSGERRCYAEILRIKGWLLSLEGDAEGAERNYLASLDWARQQQAKSWELRTTMNYARLMRDQARTKEAYDLLAPIYAWFTEGFGTKDLKDAKLRRCSKNWLHIKERHRERQRAADSGQQLACVSGGAKFSIRT